MNPIIVKKNTILKEVLLLENLFEVYCEKELEENNLTIGLYIYLSFIDENRDLTFLELTNAFNVNKAHTTRVIQKLEALNYIVKTRKSKKFEINSTETGNKVVSLMNLKIKDWENKQFSRLSVDEKQLVIKMLSNINCIKLNNKKLIIDDIKDEVDIIEY